MVGEAKGCINRKLKKDGTCNINISVNDGNRNSTGGGQPPLTSTGGNCTACFDLLNATQKTDFEDNLQNKSMVFFGVQINTIEQLCMLLEQVAANENSVRTASEITIVQRLLVDVPLVTSENVGKCLEKALNVLES